MNQNLPSLLRLTVITPLKLLVDEEVETVSLPSLEGYLGVFPGHRPLFLTLGEGKITYRVGQKEDHLAVQGGYAEILSERVVIFAEVSENETEQSAER
jgi:F-type H+-transporting ATPase subunit epsilon